MTNTEKYLKDGVDIDNLITEIVHDFIHEYIYRQDFRTVMTNFFKRICKPTLTEDERAILRHLKGFYYIHRASTGELEATNKEHTWCGYELYFDDDVFQFIKERRRI